MVENLSKTDAFGREVFDEIQTGSGFVSRQFSYHAGSVTEEHKENAKLKSSPTTNLVSQITYSGGRTLGYAYDAEERITGVVDAYVANDVSVSALTTYTYDALGQLLTETVNGEVVNTMTYDAYGNILTKNGLNYVYDNVWKDLLTSYNGQSITYDAQGNPTNYLGHNLTWEKGRQLKSFDNIQYTYNANGIRTSKTVNGIKHSFALDGSKILREEWCGNALIPLYDNADSVCGIMYNGQHYFFLKNLQGDVIAITDSNGDTVARYSYDAWGACTVTQDSSNRSIATVNPYRYRGYYFDSETGLYYLQSRYYDPSVGRFINADAPDYVAIQGGNLYAYCGNCPTKNADYAGFCYTPSYEEDKASSSSKLIDFSSIKKSISDIANNIKEFFNDLINYIKRQFSDFIGSVACRFNNGYLTISTAPIGYFIDAIITTISGIVKGALLKGGFSLIKLWFNSNKPALKSFVINTVIPMLQNTSGLINSLINYIAKRFAWKCAVTITKSKIQDRILGKYDFYKWISAVSSIGSFISTVFDILDGQWDGKLAI